MMDGGHDTRLERPIRPLVAAHPGKSGVVALSDGRDAFAVRALLADAAERTLDVQYYIWHADRSGRWLFEALRRAADRGVRVRLLLDDNNTTGLDPILAALDAHPRIEVRLFNPFKNRRWRAWGYLTDFPRLNRRMHNKSFTVDNAATIVGGRNIGDAYFGADQEMTFVDLDVLAIGPVVADVTRDFDRYWDCESSHPASRVLPAAKAPAIAAPAVDPAPAGRDPAARAYAEAISRSAFVRDLLAGCLRFEWAETRMVSDDPAKGLGRAKDSELVWPRLRRMLRTPVQEMELVSPYFVPTAAGVAFFVGLARQGVKITILTNALEATDVGIVHAGYAKWRKPLLEAGIALYELKRTFSERALKDRGLTGHSGSSLHAKTFSIDRAQLFVGSLNFDPRSSRLNTELGFVIDSPRLAEAIAETFVGNLPARAYQVRLDARGKLQWVERGNGRERIHPREPGAGFWRRAGVAVLSWLPIEWLL